MSTNPTNPLSTLPGSGALPNTPASSIASRVAAASPTKPAPVRPVSLRSGSTEHLSSNALFRCVLYSETSARKTSTAAQFACPEQPSKEAIADARQMGVVGDKAILDFARMLDSAKYTRFVLTRGEDQLLPLDGYGFKYEFAPDANAVNYALRYPEALWPDWAAMSDPERKRTIVVDDITKGVSLLVEGNAAKDNRMAYRDAQNDLDSAIQSLGRKPYNQIFIALAKTKDNPITNEEQVGPDLPPSMLNYVNAEFTAVLYVKVGVGPAPWAMLTDRDSFAYEDTDPVTGKVRTYKRLIFAKSKTSLRTLGAGPNPNAIQKIEPLDLGRFWAKCKTAGAGGKK